VTGAPSLFGITGLTVGGVGIWALVLLGLIAAFRSWVVGMPDRRRAENEGESADDRATEEARATLFEQMRKQMALMEAKIERLEKRVDELEEERSVQ